MSDLIHEARSWTPDLIAQHAVSARDTIKRLADRIESLEAERDKARSIGVQVVRQERSRADRAEARLARVADDLTGRIAHEVGYHVRTAAALGYAKANGGSGITDLELEIARAGVQSTLRAVAADEQ